MAVSNHPGAIGLALTTTIAAARQSQHAAIVPVAFFATRVTLYWVTRTTTRKRFCGLRLT